MARTFVCKLLRFHFLKVIFFSLLLVFVNWPEVDGEVINEFEFDGLASMALKERVGN